MHLKSQSVSYFLILNLVEKLPWLYTSLHTAHSLLSPRDWKAVYSGISKLLSPAIAKCYLWKVTDVSSKPRKPTCVAWPKFKSCLKVLWVYFHFSSYSRDNNRQKGRSMTLWATGLPKATPPGTGTQLSFLKEKCPKRGTYWAGTK